MSSKWKGGRDEGSQPTERRDRRGSSESERRRDRRDVHRELRSSEPERRREQRPRTPSSPPPVVKSSPTSYAGVSKSRTTGGVSHDAPSVPVAVTTVSLHPGRDYRFGDDFIHGRYHFNRWVKAYHIPLRELYHETIELIEQTTYLSKVTIPFQYDEFVLFVYNNSTGYISPDV